MTERYIDKKGQKKVKQVTIANFFIHKRASVWSSPNLGSTRLVDTNQMKQSVRTVPNIFHDGDTIRRSVFVWPTN